MRNSLLFWGTARCTYKVSPAFDLDWSFIHPENKWRHGAADIGKEYLLIVYATPQWLKLWPGICKYVLVWSTYNLLFRGHRLITTVIHTVKKPRFGNSSHLLFKQYLSLIKFGVIQAVQVLSPGRRINSDPRGYHNRYTQQPLRFYSTNQHHRLNTSANQSWPWQKCSPLSFFPSTCHSSKGN